jgi:hypothetical protein
MSPKTVYIVRHCDKPLLKKDDRGVCVEQGYQRASLLVGLTGSCIENLNICNNICQGTYTGGVWKKILGNEKPVAIYAAVSKSDPSYANDKNLANRVIKCSISNRCCLLLNPTANYYGMEINEDGGTFCDTEGSLLGQYILNQTKNNNGIVLVAWEHHDIPNLLNSLGASPQFLDWPDDAANRFDIIFKVDFSNNSTNPEITILTQNLNLEGDSNSIPMFKRKDITHDQTQLQKSNLVLYIIIGVIVFLYILFLYLFFKYF